MLTYLLMFLNCWTGPSPNTPGFNNACMVFDTDGDNDVDFRDWRMLRSDGNNDQANGPPSQAEPFARSVIPRRR